MACANACELKPAPRNTLRLTVLIPARNEEQNIERTLAEMADTLRSEGIPFELLVVDDGSADRTGEVVLGLRERVPEIRLVRNDPPNGLGRAIRCGIRHFQGDVLAVVMADRSDHPDDVVRCYRKIEEGYDAVFGSRFRRGSRVTDYPPVKLVVNRIVNKVMQVMFWTPFNDLTNAFKVYRRHVIESISPLQAAHFNITIEMSLSCIIRHYAVAEIPISWSGRTWGQSNLRLREMGRRYLCTLLMIWFERLLVLDDLLLERKPQDKPGA
ncbi:MAG TPA: glycosyltransferase family 2 protein [Candidatus Hydrogenedentes bacterium]|nr:glycosyltransferase family 2 protein [Candidatus Hydrogenedentota bacterium]HOJ67577.1 glycosyltransferase family 2 protein [Candidatus Hydrogenedentota bacterium]HOK89842.1 glycosyltransferase family 2 protein [Candidatus Hydrogenedentota bacterium]HOV61301.1 glycosyltransferase family 2 protein [Candidatus Hydrogenedentota bacterium]